MEEFSAKCEHLLLGFNNFVILHLMVIFAEGLNSLYDKSGSIMLVPGRSLFWKSRLYCSNPSEAQKHFK